MNDEEFLAQQFEEHRGHLRAVAYRMLGSAAEADDAVQEAWLRVSRAGADEVRNLGGWLTTVVARVCLNMLQARRSRREQALDDHAATGPAAASPDPELVAVTTDSVGVALLVVLDTLAPAERLAFVLHDLFGVPFEEIAPIVERSPEAARQLASRARRRVQGAPASGGADPARRREIVRAFLAASQGGDFAGLLALLDPDIVLRADAVAARAGVPAELRGPEAVAQVFAGRAHDAQLALLDGVPGLIWAPGGQPRVAFGFTIVDGRIAGIEMTADPAQLKYLDVTFVVD